MKKKIILKVLDKLDRESKMPTSKELELDREQYSEIIEIMENSKLIFGTDIIKSGMERKIVRLDTKHTKIAIDGIEYLEDNREHLD